MSVDVSEPRRIPIAKEAGALQALGVCLQRRRLAIDDVWIAQDHQVHLPCIEAKHGSDLPAFLLPPAQRPSDDLRRACDQATDGILIAIQYLGEAGDASFPFLRRKRKSSGAFNPNCLNLSAETRR